MELHQPISPIAVIRKHGGNVLRGLIMFTVQQWAKDQVEIIALGVEPQKVN